MACCETPDSSVACPETLDSIPSTPRKEGERIKADEREGKGEKRANHVLEPLAQTLSYFPWTFQEPRPCLPDPNLCGQRSLKQVETVLVTNAANMLCMCPS